jgi:hypothetical protein
VFAPASKAAFPPVTTLNNEGAVVTPATTANEEDATTLNSEEATVAPAVTANEEDITLSRAKIEKLVSLQMKKHSYPNTSCSQ